jgi:uncharacterized protein YjiS (DUF1127 family)
MTTVTIKAFPKGTATAHLRNAATAVKKLFAAYLQARREREQLLSLGERDLHDIGITRVDAINAARKPFKWRPLERQPNVDDYWPKGWA